MRTIRDIQLGRVEANRAFVAKLLPTCEHEWMRLVLTDAALGRDWLDDAETCVEDAMTEHRRCLARVSFGFDNLRDLKSTIHDVRDAAQRQSKDVRDAVFNDETAALLMGCVLIGCANTPEHMAEAFASFVRRYAFWKTKRPEMECSLVDWR